MQNNERSAADQKAQNTLIDEDTISAIENLLALLNDAPGVKAKEVEQDKRHYLRSESFGLTRYHIVEKTYSGVRIDQYDESKYPPRVDLPDDVQAALLEILLAWRMQTLIDKVKQKYSQAPASDDDMFGDLDEGSFS